MNTNQSSTKHPATGRLTLEQKIRHLVRDYRARQRRAASKAAAGARFQQTSKLTAFALVLVTLIVLPSRADVPSTFGRANEAFAAGQFREAANGYEQVIDEEGYSAPVLFNLGNAWLQAGQPGRAVLNYERALWLTPGDAAIEASLSAARKKAGLTVGEQNILEKAARVLSLSTWAWMGAVTLVLVCALVFVGRLLPCFPRTTLRVLTGTGAMVLIAAITCVAVRWPDVDRAVILDSNAPVRVAPADAAGVSFTLSAGEMVHAKRSHGGFIFVTTRDGRSGWVAGAELARVI